MGAGRGSEWRKWDLHVHTPDTKLNNQYRAEDEDVWQKFCDQIHNSDVEVFGLTDYFSIENYFKFVECYKSEYSESNKVFFPNVEFRLDSKNSNNEHIQVHVIFANRQSTLDKIDAFLTRLPLLSTDDTTCTNKYCTSSDLSLIGYEKAMVKVDTLIEKLEADFTSEEYLIVGVANGYGSLRPGNNDGRGAEYAKELDKRCHLFFGTSRNTDFFLNKIPGRKELGLPPKAILSGCDAHSFGDIENKLGKKYNETESEIVWIKADLSFEGLRQIIYEPEARLRISENKPLPPLHKLEKVKLNFSDDVKWDNDKFCFAGFNGDIIFSPNLTCVIGGRGSGKSTLLNLIANKIRKGDKDFFDKVSPLDIDRDVIFEPDTIDNIEFLAQNTIEKFATNTKEFTEAIYTRLNKMSNGELKNKESQITAKLKIFDEQIDLLQQRKDLTLQLLEIRKQLKINFNIVKTFSDKVFIDAKNELTELQKEKAVIDSSREQYKTLFESFKNIIDSFSSVSDPKNNYDEYYNEMLNDINTIFKKYKDKDYSVDKKNLEELEKQIAKQEKIIEDYLKFKGLSPENIDDAKSASQNIVHLKDDRRAVLASLNTIKNRIKSFSLDEIDIAIEEFGEKVQDELGKINTNFKNIAEQNPDEVKLIEVKYEIDERIFEKVFEELESILGLRSDISSFRKTLMEYLNSVDINRVLLCNGGNELIGLIGQKSTQAYQKLSEIFSDNLNFNIYKLLMQKHKKDISNNKVLRVYYDERPLDNSSFGQKCTAAIVVLLSLGNNPIIIDEPEAHLDSSLIANYLVELIKQQKEQRQIIFATHNANFVLNADAELIIKLENTDGSTTVKYITIENVDHREDLLKLEGGKEAFKKREQKYNI